MNYSQNNTGKAICALLQDCHDSLFSKIKKQNMKALQTTEASLSIQQTLLQIARQLKEEFIGLDSIIDLLINAVTPWCIAGDKQKHPTVVNLWGMTGVGKTSLVNRFLSLWEENIPVINFNMGCESLTADLLYNLESMGNLDGKRMVIVLDEFQHAKTIIDGRKEVDRPISRMMWQVIDEGQLMFVNSHISFRNIAEIKESLSLCLEEGVKIENGKVVEGLDTYLGIFGRGKFSAREENCHFLPNVFVDDLYDIFSARFKYKTRLRAHINSLNGDQLAEFLTEAENELSKPRSLDLRKSLIFVLGNLDEAYHMCASMSSEDDPDLFYEQSRKISFHMIKDALKNRFRVEEIARLGNIHLIYPALKSSHFREYIVRSLDQLGEEIKNEMGLEIEFDPSVIDTLFSEGVVPSQGIRPLRSTIKFVLESPLRALLLGSDLTRDALIKIKDTELQVWSGGEFCFGTKVNLPILEGKKLKSDAEVKAVTAVHECGHALVFAVLKGKFPAKISIASSDYRSGGFVRGGEDRVFESRDSIRKDTAIRLAGYLAEEMVFGRDYVTDGAEGDIEVATKGLVHYARKCGFEGRLMAMEHHHLGHEGVLNEDSHTVEWVKQQLEEAESTARLILERKKDAFRALLSTVLVREVMNGKEMEGALLEQGISLESLCQHIPGENIYTTNLDRFLEGIGVHA